MTAGRWSRDRPASSPSVGWSGHGCAHPASPPLPYHRGIGEERSMLEWAARLRRRDTPATVERETTVAAAY
ncbi:MAG: hypothetical protein LC769_00885, partial [Chloroflexi bacterium]|nr:hypothetical protein [Chloroflexota bacterium]